MRHQHLLGLFASNHVSSTSFRIASRAAPMNNIYQHPKVEARSLWRQRALALNSEAPYSNSPYQICHTCLNVCVRNSRGEQLPERLRDNTER